MSTPEHGSCLVDADTYAVPPEVRELFTKYVGPPGAEEEPHDRAICRNAPMCYQHLDRIAYGIQQNVSGLLPTELSLCVRFDFDLPTSGNMEVVGQEAKQMRAKLAALGFAEQLNYAAMVNDYGFDNAYGKSVPAENVEEELIVLLKAFEDDKKKATV